jgi:hypothetical protein
VLWTLNYDTFLFDESEAEEKIYIVKFHGTQRDHVVRFIPKKKRSPAVARSLNLLEYFNIKHIPEEYILKR